MTIDSHHHFWNYSAEEYGWIGEGMDVLKRDHGPADLKPLIDEAGIDGVVSVQARTSLEENDALLGHAEANEWIRGVVGWVDLTQESVGEALGKYAGREKFVGVREVLQGMDDDAYCLRDDFNRGVSQLHDFGLVYDVLIFHRHLPNAIKFVDRHPSQVFVLDHVAKPAIDTSRPLESWTTNMKSLGEREHVFCKLSGLVTEVAEGIEWTPEFLRPYFEVALDAFGPDRLMFGSDWPVCRLKTDYLRWKRTVDGFVATLSDSERAAILGGNAIRAYGLG
ncbi:MAG: amidohydrolase family protein [Verrucomicrobiae bacterium]|nr:amidohydrolase family protein [Verrucomicrobiae bacterium]